MWSLLMEGGVIMYPLFLVTAAVIVYAVLALRGVRHAYAQVDPGLESTIDAVLFWGIFAVVLGMLGTLVGIVQAAGVIQRAGGVHAALAWGGIRVALTPSIYALLLFGAAAITWFLLRRAYVTRRLDPAT